MSDTEKNFAGDKKDGGKKKDGKKDKKEKGYVMFDADASDEELMVGDDLKSPSKMKKGKAFRFGPKKDKDDKKEKDGRKEEKKKEEKEGKKHKLKGKKKSKHRDMPNIAVPETYDKPVFGVPLSLALERNRSHDGIQLPALFRECIDYIEEHGLNCEGIYRISGVKSKVQHLKDSYNRGEPACLEEHEPNIVAGVLKQFLRELPDPVLTNALIPRFEEASTIRNERKRIEGFHKLICELPECNKLLLSWMIVHMTHVIERQKDNKMTLQNVSIVLSPTMQISHRVLNVLFSHTRQLFKSTIIKRYIPPLKPATSKWSLDLPDNPQALEEELCKQESLLNQLHQELAAGEGDAEKEEQIWEVQRVCTQLKRKIKLAHKSQDSLEKRKRDRDELSRKNTVPEEEELRMELQEPPEGEVLRLELRQPPQDAPQPEPITDEDTTPVGEVTEQSRDTTPTDSKTQKEAVEQKLTLKEMANQNKAKKGESTEKVNKVGVSQDDVPDSKVDKSEKQIVKEEARAENIEKESEGKEITSSDIKEPSEAENVTIETETEEARAEMETVEVKDDTKLEVSDGDIKKDGDKEGSVENVTAEDVRASMEQKQEIYEDTTDSELGKSTEDIQSKDSLSEDEFEHSLEEILERECNIESDGTDHEMVEEKSKQLPDTAQLTDDKDDTTVAMDTKTPVPMDTMSPEPEDTTESPQANTPVPHSVSDDTVVDTEELVQCPYDSHHLLMPKRFEAHLAMCRETYSGGEYIACPYNTSHSVPQPEYNHHISICQDRLVEQPSEDAVAVVDSVETQREDDVEMQISEVSEDESYDEEEYELLLEQENALQLEEEELLAIERELRKKIETEKCETDRLQQEIDEIQYLRQDSDEEVLSTSSDSSYESEDEDDLQEILNTLIMENEELETSSSKMCAQIHEERMICLDVKVQIGILQQKQVHNSAGSESFMEKDSLIEFD